MRKLLLSAIVLLSGFAGMSQGYYTLDEIGAASPFTWLPATSSTKVLMDAKNGKVDNELSSAQNIPFAFNFMGDAVTQYKVSENGYITFDVNESTSNGSNEALPSATAPKKAIFAFWDDLDFRQNGNFLYSARTYTMGAAPNRIHVIQWFQASSAADANQAELLSFAVVLKEAGDFDVIYSNDYVFNGQSNFSESGTVGYQNGDGTVGALYKTNDQQFPKPASSADGSAIVINFISGTQHDEDIAMVSIDMKEDLIRANAPFDVLGIFRNVGKNAITKYQLFYRVNGGTPVKVIKSGTNIASGSYYNFNNSDSWTPATAGKYTIEVWTEMPNDMTDGNTDNDKLTMEVTVHDDVVQRLPLYEIFTSSTCGPCRPGNENFHSVIKGKQDECVYIKYQQSWPGTGDPYCTAESNTRRNFYGVNSIPRMELDGEWDQNAQSFTSNIHNDYTSRPAFMGISGTYSVRWDGMVSATVEVDPLKDYSGNNTLFVALVEGTTYLNKKSNGESEFTSVMKKMLSGASGTSLGTLTKGSKVSKTFSHDFNGSYTLPPNGQSANWPNLNSVHTIENWDDLFVVMWVQNMNTKEVYQAGRASQMTLGVKELEDENSVSVYPNPTAGVSTVEFNLAAGSDVTIEVTNSLGQVVKVKELGFVNPGAQSNELSLEGMNDGIYFVNVKTANGSVTKTLVLNK
jgi:hypothetical protein